MKTNVIIKFLFVVLIMTFMNVANAQNYVPGEIIVQLKSDVTPAQLSQQHTQISLTQIERISEVLNIWLFQYNTQSIQPDDCLNLIRQSNLVKTAQFNHYTF